MVYIHQSNYTDMAFDIHKLKGSSEFLNLLVDNISSAIFIVDKDIAIQSFNNSFAHLFGDNERQIFGELCGNVLGCVYVVEAGSNCGDTTNCQACMLRGSLLRAFLQHVPTTRQKLAREFYLQGRKVMKYFVFTTKYIEYEGRDMVLVIVDDMTEIEEQKLRLEQLNEQKNRFLGIAAHDLRNPIGAIQSFGEFLRQGAGLLEVEDQKRFLGLMVEASSQALTMINDLLDISTIEAGKLVLKPCLTDYANFLEQNVQINQALAAKKQIVIDVVFRIPRPFEAVFDRNKIGQVADNLISNAVKYSAPGTRVEVVVETAGNMLITHVKDHGQGIPEDELGKLFQEFGKTSVQATAGERSTGLGLVIAKRIVEGHGGKIWVESKVGQGSVFSYSMAIEGLPA